MFFTDYILVSRKDLKKLLNEAIRRAIDTEVDFEIRKKNEEEILEEILKNADPRTKEVLSEQSEKILALYEQVIEDCRIDLYIYDEMSKRYKI